MIDFMLTIGQMAAAMLVIYGGVLTIGTVMPALDGEILLLKPLQNDA
ncbi:MAG TPA: hypothetical protein VNP36_20560 [Burkholderiales bacterium]|nr:hypothetical protein [Burkholderiales bacterium]